VLETLGIPRDDSEGRRKHRLTNYEYWGVKAYTSHELSAKYRRTREMYYKNPIWPKEVEWLVDKNSELIPEQLPARVGDRALPVPAEKLRGLPGSPELTELMDGLRALKVARATRSRLYRVQHPEEPDPLGGGTNRPNARPLDTAFGSTFRLSLLVFGKEDLPVDDSLSKTTADVLRDFLMLDDTKDKSGDPQADFTDNVEAKVVFEEMGNPSREETVLKYVDSHFQ
jgi:hypothetical protein